MLELEHKAKKFNFSGIREARDWLTENAGAFYKFFSLKYKDKTIQITKKNNAISKAMKNFGVTLIITTESDQSPKQILDNYRCKDIAEKIFDIAKNDIGIRRIRTGITHVASGKFFIAFIASILRLMIEDKLRNTNLLHSYSVDEALALLKKVKRIKLPDGTVSICEIPKKTRAIANALNITFNEI